MGMELLSFHDQFVAYLSAHEEHDNFTFIGIIQDAQVAHPQFEVSEKIGAQSLDSFGRFRGLVLQAGPNSRFQDPLLTCR
ncbi:MAG TPA: hypothetical protein VNK04_04115 [Gemmataceae bacterium]|nr:hypothetical protein [Gemmataceae bacterium]